MGTAGGDDLGTHPRTALATREATRYSWHPYAARRALSLRFPDSPPVSSIMASRAVRQSVTTLVIRGRIAISEFTGLARWPRTRGLRTLCVSVGLVPLLACGNRGSQTTSATGQDLTRETALDLLRPRAKPLIISIYTAINAPCAERATVDDPTELSRRWDALIADGIVAARDTSFRGPQGQLNRMCLLRMTPRVAPAVAATWTQERDPGGFAYKIPAAQLVPSVVTGIAQGAAGKEGAPDARVEFTWKWAPTSTTPYLTWPHGYPNRTGAGTALMRRYDDGWRVMTVSYGSADAL